MRVVVDVDEKLIKNVQNKLESFSRKAPNAIANALNRAATNVRSNMSKEVRKEYTIKAKDVKETINKSRAHRGDLSVVVKSKGSVIPLDRFKVSPKTVNPRRKRPIKVSVKKGEVKPLLKAFVADIHGAKVFERKGRSRLPIRRLFGPSVPQMINNKEVREKIEKEGFDTFQRRLDHEIQRILEKGRS